MQLSALKALVDIGYEAADVVPALVVLEALRNRRRNEQRAALDPRFELIIDEPGKATVTLEDKFCSAQQAADYAMDYFRCFRRTGTYVVTEDGKEVRRGEGIPF